MFDKKKINSELLREFAEDKAEMILSMLEKGMPLEMIAEIAKLTINQIEEIRNHHQNHR